MNRWLNGETKVANKGGKMKKVERISSMSKEKERKKRWKEKKDEKLQVMNVVLKKGIMDRKEQVMNVRMNKGMIAESLDGRLNRVKDRTGKKEEWIHANKEVMKLGKMQSRNKWKIDGNKEGRQTLLGRNKVLQWLMVYRQMDFSVVGQQLCPVGSGCLQTVGNRVHQIP